MEVETASNLPLSLSTATGLKSFGKSASMYNKFYDCYERNC